MDRIPSLENFLSTIKLTCLAEMLSERDIRTVNQLFQLDDDALKGLGVEKPGHRKRMINELKSLRLRLETVEKENISPGIEEAQIPRNKNEQGCLENNNEVGNVEMAKEEVDIERQTTVDVSGDILPPIPPKKTSNTVPPTPLPRSQSIMTSDSAHSNIELKPPTPLPRIPQTLDASDFSPKIQENDTCLKEASLSPTTPNLIAPAIPPRIDLEEPEDAGRKPFVEKTDDISRSKSMPMRRLAPMPPVSRKSMKEEVLLSAPSACTQNDQSQKGADEEVPTSPVQNDTEPNMRPTSCSIVKNAKFLEQLGSKILTPKRPAPTPPKNGPHQSENGNMSDNTVFKYCKACFLSMN